MKEFQPKPTRRDVIKLAAGTALIALGNAFIHKDKPNPAKNAKTVQEIIDVAITTKGMFGGPR